MTDIRLSIEPEDSPLDPQMQQDYQQQIAQLGIKVNPNNKRDYVEIYKILNFDLYYPNSHLASLHRNANKLGEIDSKIIKQVDTSQTLIRVKNKICNCCGFFIQEDELSVCTHGILDVNNLGSSTIVFFRTFTNLAILLIIMFCVYSIFSFTTNLTTANSNNYHNSWNGTLDYLSISLSAKINSNNQIAQNAQNYYLISSWLGVPMLVIWSLCFICMSRGIKKIQNQEKLYTSIADFSVVVQKMPTGLTKQSVQSMIDQYFKRIAPEDVGFKQLKIEKYNQAQPFYFNVQEFKNQSLKQLYQRLREIKEEIVQWIEERKQEEDFSSTQPYRNERLNQLEEVKKNIRLKNQEIINQVKKRLRQRKKQAKTFVFITFETIEQRDFFLSYNDNSILSKIKNMIPCTFRQQKRFSVTKDGRQFKNIIIQSAPQPEDINWGNIGFGECQSIWRKFITFFATLIILGISFIIVYGLSTIQNSNSKKRFVSILISLVISVVNIIIIKVIQSMTVVQKIYTNNNFQISLAFKSILAQLLNTIFIPIIVNIYIKDNLYGESGLTQDIFILAIANSFIPPIIRLIDPYYIFVYLRYQFYNRPYNKMVFSQYELNSMAQKPQYQIGLQYIYLVSNFLFICFFVSLQPIIPIFGIIGLFLMYWIQKYSLYCRAQRPIPGIDTIGVIIYQMIYFGGISYVLGSLTWSIFIKTQNFENSLVANLVAAGLALAILIFPYDALLNYKQNINYKKSYQDRRVYFSAQYDRLNPATKQEGVQQYKQFLLKKREEIDGMTDIMQQNINDQLVHLTQNNTYKKNAMGNNIFGNDEVSMGLFQLMQNQSRNVIDPKILRSYLGLRGRIDQNLVEYLSAIQLRDANPFKDQTKTNLKQPFQRHNQLNRQENLQNQYNFERKPDDDFKNMYKSTLNLEDLGIASKIIPRKSKS